MKDNKLIKWILLGLLAGLIVAFLFLTRNTNPNPPPISQSDYVRQNEYCNQTNLPDREVEFCKLYNDCRSRGLYLRPHVDKTVGFVCQ